MKITVDGHVIHDSIMLAQIILSNANVAVVPGYAFGTDCHLRLSYATSMENIIEGLNRIENFVHKYI